MLCFVFRYTVRWNETVYPNCTNRTLDGKNITRDGNTTNMASEDENVTRWNNTKRNETACDATQATTIERSYLRNISNEIVDTSLKAASLVLEMLQWKDYWVSESANGKMPPGRLVKLQGLNHAVWLEGYYERTGETSNGRPILKHQHQDFYMYSTTEWFSTDPLWAVGPDLNLSKAR